MGCDEWICVQVNTWVMMILCSFVNSLRRIYWGIRDVYIFDMELFYYILDKNIYIFDSIHCTEFKIVPSLHFNLNTNSQFGCAVNMGKPFYALPIYSNKMCPSILTVYVVRKHRKTNHYSHIHLGIHSRSAIRWPGRDNVADVVGRRTAYRKSPELFFPYIYI